ncbi:MAG TPA: glycerophosphodiester phosphodiesterase [Thermoanaerobaculia bacterium]|nr:glycerophosphodiester phosphodiesterase [Thermoanaerobaculia bacterium]
MSFLIFGHRGSPYKEHENSVASFEAALAAGADGFETDLRLLADGAAVLFHDDDYGEEPVESRTSADVDAAPLDVLAQFAGRCTMVLEVKRAKWEDTLLDHIAPWPNIVVASFDHRTIDELHRRGARFPLGLTYVGAIVDVVTYAKRLGATWLFPRFQYVDRELVEAAHTEGVTVVPWTPNRERDWLRLREIGCDGVITDFPDRAVQWNARLR